MVIDASALLAVLLEEPYGEWVVRMLENHPTSLCMSTVNLTETLIILSDRRKGSLTAFEQKIYGAGIAFAPTTVLHAQIAAQARHTFRINLGDCFAYALAVTENLPLPSAKLPFVACRISSTSPCSNS